MSAYVPYSLAPSWNLVAVPHEAAYKGPYGRDEEGSGYEDGRRDHDRFHKDAEEQNMEVRHQGTRENENGEQRDSVQ